MVARLRAPHEQARLREMRAGYGASSIRRALVDDLLQHFVEEAKRLGQRWSPVLKCPSGVFRLHLNDLELLCFAPLLPRSQRSYKLAAGAPTEPKAQIEEVTVRGETFRRSGANLWQ